MTDRIVRLVLRGDISGLIAPLREAQAAVRSTADEMTAATPSAESFRDSLSELSQTAGAFGLASAAGFGAVVLAAAGFDAAMSRVDAATHETTGNMEKLSAAAIKAGADTVFSATEAADAITALSKAGVSTQDILSGGLSGSLSLASAGELDVASAAEIAATAMNQFGLAGQDIPHIADLLAAAAGKAQGEVSDMALAFKYVGPVAHQMGISIEETTGAVAELAAQGILADSAGTGLRGILTSLSSPSKLAADEMKKLGINLYDATGKFVGFKGIAGELHRTLSDLTNAERDQALGRIFGNQQITAARILYAGGAEDVAKWTKSVDENGFAADTAARKMNNLKGDFEQFTGSLQTLFITTGEGAQGPLRQLTQGATNAVNALNKLSPEAKNAATSLLGITAVVGGGAFLGSLVLTRITATRAALTELGVTATQTRALMAGVGTGFAIGGAILALRALSEAMEHNFDNADLPRNLQFLAENADGVSEKFDGLVTDIHRLNDSGVHFLEPLNEAMSGFGLLNKTGLDQAQGNITAIDQALASMVESGNADKAARAFDRIMEAAKEDGTSGADVRKNFNAYATAIANLGTAAESTRKPMDLLSGQFLLGAFKQGAAVAEWHRHTAAVKENAKALELNRAIANKTASGFITLGQDVNNAKVSLNGWIKELEDQAKALEDFADNAVEAGNRGLRQGLIAELEAAGPAGALRLKQLADGTKEQIHRANLAFDAGRRAIQDYTDAIGGIKNPVIKPKIDMSSINAAIRSVRTFNSLISTGILGIAAPTANVGSPAKPGGIDGDPNTWYASGGYTGWGGKYEKAGTVHRGEYVFSAEATSGNVGDLEAMHRAMRHGASVTAAAGAGVDMGEMHELVASMRPMIGTQINQPYDWNGYQLQKQQNERMAASGGSRRGATPR